MASNLSYLQPTQEAGSAYFSNPPQWKVVMLNLLRFRKVADYSSSPELAPEEPISGIEVYNLYVLKTTGHRTAALKDSRLLPVTPTDSGLLQT